jgi:hypothetical protein
MWTHAIKANAILMVLGVVTVIAGFSLADLADPLITFVDSYKDDERNKPTDLTYDESNRADIFLHLATATGAYQLFFWMTMGAYIWAWSFLDIRDAGADFECEIKNQDYSALAGVVAKITSRETCLEHVDELFDIADLNGDNYIDRCEDANFQAA